MIEKQRRIVHTIRMDQAGIDKLKNDFFDEARDFVYFRKGEWHGFSKSFKHAKNWAMRHSEWVSTSAAFYSPPDWLVHGIIEATGATIEAVKKYFNTRGPKEKIVTRKVIVTEGRLSASEISEWEDICGPDGIATIPQLQAGPFRYIVDERRYAIFSRLDRNNLQGIMGHDEESIAMLRYCFDREFILAKMASSDSTHT